MTQKAIIEKLNDKNVKTFLKKYGIKHISLFGSFVNGNPNKESDIDLLYEQDDKINLGWEFFDVVEFLQDTLGKKVDMIEKNYINSRIKKNVLATKLSIW